MITPDYRLAIDFSNLQEIPQDPRERLPYFNALKEVIQSEKEKIKSWHRSGAGGREVIQSYTSLIDEFIRHVILSMIRLENISPLRCLKIFHLSPSVVMEEEN